MKKTFLKPLNVLCVATGISIFCFGCAALKTTGTTVNSDTDHIVAPTVFVHSAKKDIGGAD